MRPFSFLHRAVVISLALCAASCGDDSAGSPVRDAGAVDDASTDSSVLDGTLVDATSETDAGPFDAGPFDAGPTLCEPVQTPSADAGAPRDTDRCVDEIITTGFRWRWRDLNHRISLLGAHPVLGASDPAEGCDIARGASVETSFIGGTFTTGEMATDAPIVGYDYAAVNAREVGATTESEPLRTYRGSTVFDVDPSQEGSLQERVELVGAGLAAAPHVIAVIDGVLFATDVPQSDDYPDDYDPADGYTSRGIGVELTNQVVAEGALTFDVNVRFAHGPQDREDMNRAIPFAQTQVTVNWLLVGLDVPPASAEVSYYDDSPYQGFGMIGSVCRPSSEMTAIDFAGQPGVDHAIAALTSFDFALFPETDEGDYVRELSVRITDFTYDATTGGASALFEGYATNESFFTALPMNYSFAGRAALLQWNGGDPPSLMELSTYSQVGTVQHALALDD